MAVEADPDVAPRGVVRAALRDTWTSLRSVFVNPALRRIELALAGSMIGDWAYATAIVVWAYGEGGAHLVGVWGAVRLLLMAFAAPIGSTLADRLPRKAVLIGSDLTRSVLVSIAAALIALDAPTLAILALATLQLAHRLRVPPGTDGVDAVPGPDARRADCGQRRLEHDREPGLLPRARHRSAPHQRDEHPDGADRQRRHVRRLGRPRVRHTRHPSEGRGHARGRRPRPRRRAGARRSASCGRWAGASPSSGGTGTC